MNAHNTIKFAEEKMAMEAVTKLHNKGLLQPTHEPNKASRFNVPDYLLHYDYGKVLLEIVNASTFNISAEVNNEGERTLISSQQNALKVIWSKAIAGELGSLLKQNESITISMDMPLLWICLSK